MLSRWHFFINIHITYHSSYCYVQCVRFWDSCEMLFFLEHSDSQSSCRDYGHYQLCLVFLFLTVMFMDLIAAEIQDIECSDWLQPKVAQTVKIWSHVMSATFCKHVWDMYQTRYFYYLSTFQNLLCVDAFVGAAQVTAFNITSIFGLSALCLLVI